MKKTILSALGILAFGAFAFSQTPLTQVDPTNVREGESVEYCTTHKKQQELLLNPSAVASFAQDEIIRQQEAANGVATPKGTIYYIPIVFHLLHNGGLENISDEQIMDALNILNRDYRKLNADANNVQATFQGLPSDVEIEFRLATIAPNGECFSGITRTQNVLSNDGSDGNAQVNAIISGNNVYNGQWDGDKYLNIFICGEIGGAAGYTYTPSNWIGSSMANGIWILHNYVGAIGTSSAYSSRALTHEVGHWLNLEHTWGGNNNPGNMSSCSTDDGVSDTPNTIGVTSCNLNEASCGPLANVENYMDYSYCSKMFTPGQTTRMRNAITSNVANRDNLITNTNLVATGATGTVYLCSAQFEADRTTICAGDQITFEDMSFNVVNGWTWTFAGGSPASSTSQNPSVTYATPGLYTVTLTATDGPNTDTETKTSYIRVLPAAAGLPFHESFESFTTLTNVTEWEIENLGGNAWTLHTGTGYTGTKCVKLTNFGQSAGQIDNLISSPIDLSGITATAGVTMSFRYSYVKRYTSNSEVLKVYVTPNCGENWAARKTLSGTQLATTAQNSAWTPTSQANWVTVHLTNITSGYWTDKFRCKFEFESDGGNNIYLDDINIYEGAPSENIVTAGIEENGLDIDGLSVYPNPTDNDLSIRFALTNAEQTNLIVQDLSGKIVQSAMVNANEGSNLVMMDVSQLASGMYFLKVHIGTSQKTIQFVVQ